MTRETELLARVLRQMGRTWSDVRAVAARLAEWDVSSALAEVAQPRRTTRAPRSTNRSAWPLEDGRHPVVERLAAAGPLRAQRRDFGRGRRAPLAHHRPEHGGKVDADAAVALIVILAQAGSFVPARRARIGIVDRVLTRVGASDNLAKGDSTFMVEMKETAHVLRRATRRSLVVLDEIGRGTSTYDGLSIAWAVAEHLHDAIWLPRYVRHALPRAHRARFHAHRLRKLQRVGARARGHAHLLAQAPAGRGFGAATAWPAHGSRACRNSCSSRAAPFLRIWNAERLLLMLLVHPRFTCGGTIAPRARSSIFSARVPRPTTSAHRPPKKKMARELTETLRRAGPPIRLTPLERCSSSRSGKKRATVGAM